MDPRTVNAVWTEISIQAAFHFSIRESLILGNHTDHIHTETVDSLVTPEFHHIVNFLAHFLIFPVQIRLFFGKQMQVIHLCLIVVFPCRTAEYTAPVIWLFSVYRIFPDIIVTVRIILGLFALQEPLMFV